MKYQMIYRGAVLAIPAAAGEVAERAGSADWRLLFAVASGEDPAGLGLTEEQIEHAAALWGEAGVLERIGEPTVRPVKAKAVKVPPKKERQLPKMSGDELARFMSENAAAADYIKSCEDAAHRVFNIAEINTVLSLKTYYSLDESYILLLITHLYDDVKRKNPEGRLSVATIESRAYSLVSRGVTTYAELEAYVKEWESAHELEGTVRRIFGTGTRVFTEKERAALARWASWGYGEDTITIAYEKTINNINKPSIAYADKIIERWHTQNLTTREEIAASESEYKQTKSGGSFDTDEFFEAAIKRGYGE